MPRWLMTPTSSTLFPYTTLFRSEVQIPGRAEIGTNIPAPRLRHRGCVVGRSEEHTSELQSRREIVCRLLLEKKKISYVFDQSPFVTGAITGLTVESLLGVVLAGI